MSFSFAVNNRSRKKKIFDIFQINNILSSKECNIIKHLATRKGLKRSRILLNGVATFSDDIRKLQI